MTWDSDAETAGPRGRAELWPALIAANPSLESAQAKAGRELPVVVLSRRERGIRGLRDRIEALGGRMQLASPAGHGTHLHATIAYPGTIDPA